MNGLQFVRMLQGKLEIDEDRKQQVLTEYKRDYPFGEITFYESDGELKVECKGLHNNKPLCMKCGNPLNDRANYRLKKGEWTPLKRKDNLSNRECPICYPKGFAPLMIMTCVAKE